MSSKRSISHPKTVETHIFPELCKNMMVIQMADFTKSEAQKNLKALNASCDDTNRLKDIMKSNDNVTEGALNTVKGLMENATESLQKNNNYFECGKCYDLYGRFMLQCENNKNINERNYTEAFDAFVKSSESYEKGNDYRSAISAMGVALSVHEKDLKMDRTGKINYQNTAIFLFCFERLTKLHCQALNQCKHSEYDELMIRNYKYLCHAINGEKSNKEESVNNGVGDTHNDACDLSEGIREENENEVLNDITDYGDYGDETQVICESSRASDATEMLDNSGRVSKRLDSINCKKRKRTSVTEPNERLNQLTEYNFKHDYVIYSENADTHLKCLLCSVGDVSCVVKSDRLSTVTNHLFTNTHKDKCDPVIYKHNCNAGKMLKEKNKKRKMNAQKISGHTNGTNLNSLASSSDVQITSLELAAPHSDAIHVPLSTVVPDNTDLMSSAVNSSEDDPVKGGRNDLGDILLTVLDLSDIPGLYDHIQVNFN